MILLSVAYFALEIDPLFVVVAVEVVVAPAEVAVAVEVMVAAAEIFVFDPADPPSFADCVVAPSMRLTEGAVEVVVGWCVTRVG